jgi:hypothetical protein
VSLVPIYTDERTAAAPRGDVPNLACAVIVEALEPIAENFPFTSTTIPVMVVPGSIPNPKLWHFIWYSVFSTAMVEVEYCESSLDSWAALLVVHA